MRVVFIFVSILIFAINSFAGETQIYRKALENLAKEKKYYIETYPESKIKKLEKNNYSKIKYSKRIKSILKGINDAEKILYRKLRNTRKNKSLENSIVVFLDPGHGGIDKGANFKSDIVVGGNKKELTEKEINFAISKMIKRKLERKGYIVILSRDTVNEGPSLYARSALCRAIEPDIAVSIHLNSSEYAIPLMNRVETAMPEMNFTKVFVWLPSKIDLFIPFYYTNVKKMETNGTRKKSIYLADSIAKELKSYLNLDYDISEEERLRLVKVIELRESIYPTKKEVIHLEKYPPVLLEKYTEISTEYENDIKDYPGIAGKDLHMVREIPAVPSVLVESVFLSCPYEQYKLVFKKRKNKIADAVAHGIENYFKEKK